MGKKPTIVVVAIFILLAGGALGFYYYDRNKTQPDVLTENSETSENEITTTKSPKERFLEYKSALENAKSYDEAVELSDRYLSKALDTEELGYEQINMSVEEKNQLFIFLSEALRTESPLVKDILEINEEIAGTTGRLIIKIKGNKVCGVPIFLENNEWRFGVTDCKKDTGQSSQNLPTNTIVSCGSIKSINIIDIDARISIETNALHCMADAPTNCTPMALTVSGAQTATYQVENKENQYCNMSKNTAIKTTCHVPLVYISGLRQKYKSPNADDMFLRFMISIIDTGGKITDGSTKQTKIEFTCQ